MTKENLKISIAHLYPKYMNLYGDIGNIITLKSRCMRRGIEVEFDEINSGDKISNHDLYFIGGGQDKQQEEVVNELFSHKSELTSQMNDGAVFLGICGGYQLMGEYYQPHDAKRLEGIGILNAYTVAGSNRFIGNVTAKTDLPIGKDTLVGFENHSGLTYLRGETTPMAHVVVGHGNNGVDKTEGARSRNAFGTYLHGSFLPKNPHFADYMIKLALKKKYNDDIELEPLDDTIEMKAHESVLYKTY